MIKERFLHERSFDDAKFVKLEMLQVLTVFVELIT
jgi:hypothetical protein